MTTQIQQTPTTTTVHCIGCRVEGSTTEIPTPRSFYQCFNCSEYDKILDRDGNRRLDREFKVGKFNLVINPGTHSNGYYTENQWAMDNRHFIVDITDVTKCMLSYTMLDVTAGWTTPNNGCRRKISPRTIYCKPSVKFPPKMDLANGFHFSPEDLTWIDN